MHLQIQVIVPTTDFSFFADSEIHQLIEIWSGGVFHIEFLIPHVLDFGKGLGEDGFQKRIWPGDAGCFFQHVKNRTKLIVFTKIF